MEQNFCLKKKTPPELDCQAIHLLYTVDHALLKSRGGDPEFLRKIVRGQIISDSISRVSKQNFRDQLVSINDLS